MKIKVGEIRESFYAPETPDIVSKKKPKKMVDKMKILEDKIKELEKKIKDK